MVNTDIQGLIPLEGAGFVARRNGDFRPGEFKRLSNIEQLNESLVNRRAVKSVAGSSAGVDVGTPHTNCLGFMGNLKMWSIVASSTEQLAVGPGDKQSMWAPTNLVTPAEAGSFHRIIGYFRYIKKNYWITLEYRGGIHIKIKLYHGNASTSADVPETYNAAYFATLTETTLYTLLPADPSFNDFKFNNFIMQGNRLWLFTSLGVYFSKATDPTIFAAPDGGFFKFPDQVINHGCSLKDNIYVFTDNSIHVIQYTTDPNVDSFVTQISDNLGGEDSTVFKDAVYCINQVGIYRILNGSIDKVIDNEFDVGLDYYRNGITSFEDYLVVNKYTPVNYEKFTSSATTQRVNLHPNPSVETNLTGFGGSDSFMLRTREDLNPAVGGFSPYSGTDFVVKCQKINDTTQVRYTNLYKNPSFEVDTSFHTAGGSSVLATQALVGTPEGAKVLQAAITVDRNDSNPNGVVTKIIWESDFYPATVDECLYFNFSERRSAEMDNNDGTMYARLYAYDAAFNLINAGGIDYQIEKAMSNTNNVFHRDYLKYKLDDAVVAGLAGVAHVKIKFVLKTKRKSNEVFTHYWDKISYFKVDQTTFDAISAPDYIPYFDGNTADVANVAVYDWTGTVGKSSSTQKGTLGSTTQQKKLLEYTANNIIVSPLKTYTIGTAFAQPINDQGNLEVHVRQYNAADVLLSTTILFLGSTSSNTAWSYFTNNIVAATTADHIELDYRLSSPMDALEFVYLDAFIVELNSTYKGYFDGSFVDTSAVDYAWSGVAHASTSTAIISNLPRALFLQGKFFDEGQQFNSLGYNTYFLNMENGSVHVMDFRDALDLSEADRGRVSEIYVNPNKDSSGNYNLFFYTARKTAESGGSYTFSNRFYWMSSFRDLDFTDYAVQSNNVLQSYPPKVEIEIDSFAPDGSEYLMKKFRHLLMMAKLPATDFRVKFGFDDSDYGNEVILNSPNVAERPHSPYRVRINQRCRSISIFFSNTTYDVPLTLPLFGVVEISDLRTLWSYSGRAIDRSSL